ncbi:4-pyridoxate dehydrogenase-like [Ornithodoros turicata]|uniref:4-pyridoxate dehydrogenase-like n=1 Tax=Ornithodoros turicata TaxID=34597 RepID=UPI003139291D
MDIELPHTPKPITFTLTFLIAAVTFTIPPPDSYYDKSTILPQYDYVIVGGGSAGCVLANKLSEDPNITVLVIEAGKSEDATTLIPLTASLQINEHFDWKYRTVPQKNACLSVVDKVSRWTSGKVLGGSSAINFLIYKRGNPEDYDRWEKAGAAGWAYKDVLPYFKDVENFMVQQYVKNGYHGTNGSLPITTNSFQTLLSRKFMQACAQKGYKRIDYNADTQKGYSRVQNNILDGRRVSSSKAWIQPIVDERPNLHITLSSFATKIILDGRIARGVTFEKDGVTYTVSATQEVIISAGTVRSPQLLMVSGIGPREHLKSLGIPVVADLPVGDNLKDHVTVGGITAFMKADADLQVRDPNALLNYITKSTGPFSVGAGIESLLYPQTKYVTTPDYSDVELAMISLRPGIEETKQLLTDVGFPEEGFDAYFGPHQNEPGFQLYPLMYGPKSKGVLRLRSSDPHDHPLIDPRYYSHPDDVKRCVAAVKIALDVVSAKALREDLGAKIWDIPYPSCKQHKLWSEKYIACMCTHLTFTSWDFSGTCRMGNGTNSVVTPRLCVCGIGNLRVVDASVMPENVAANSHAPVQMVAMKGAAMILEDYYAKRR